MSANLLVELFVEELPPKALRKLGEAFASRIKEMLVAAGLAQAEAAMQVFASPRRLAVHLAGVLSQAPDVQVQHKLVPVSVGFDAAGQPSAALTKKLASVGADATALSKLERHIDGKSEVLFLPALKPGLSIAVGLQLALDESLRKLPIPKVMSYQLADGWRSVHFVRPAHGLVALHGADVVAVQALGLQAGRSTRGHRFEAAEAVIELAHADDYAARLREAGAVIASFEQRRAEVARQLAAAAAKEGLTPIADDALLDEVTALVERPNVLSCQFEPQFLAVPQECLILTMKANQKYFPLLDAQGKLTHKFLVVSNIAPADASAVVQGNERVVRPRLADAKFFFDQDRKRTLESRLPLLDKVVYHNKLGSQGQRLARVAAMARAIGQLLGDDALAAQAHRAARLAKADLITDMVGEFPELQGTMGGYYARHDGEPEAVALAVEDHYRPRFAGDALPRNEVGLAVALADKLETLVGLFGVGQQPTGDKDPFALRRHALGVIRMLVERDLPLSLPAIVKAAHEAFGAGFADATPDVTHFMYDRLVGYLRELGYSAQEVDAVLALRPPRWAELPKRLAAVRAFAALPEAASLAAANKRIANILKKSTDTIAPVVNEALFQEPREERLWARLQETAETANWLFDHGDYTESLQALAGLRDSVDAFFDGVMVNAKDDNVRLNRLGLLAKLHAAMNRVADLSRLAS